MATASNDLPCKVRSKKYQAMANTDTVQAMMKKLWYEPASKPHSKRPNPKAAGTACGSGPKPMDMASRKTTNMPNKDKMGARGGAPDSTKGRTVKRSVSHPTTNIMATMTAMPTG